MGKFISEMEAEMQSVCHECGEWRRECVCCKHPGSTWLSKEATRMWCPDCECYVDEPQCEEISNPLWPDMADSDYDA